jgi:hypothetical protein
MRQRSEWRKLAGRLEPAVERGPRLSDERPVDVEVARPGRRTIPRPPLRKPRLSANHGGGDVVAERI